MNFMVCLELFSQFCVLTRRKTVCVYWKMFFITDACSRGKTRKDVKLWPKEIRTIIHLTVLELTD